MPTAAPSLSTEGARVAKTREDMSFLVAPPSHRQDRSPEGDEVDQLLRSFYRAEMPDPWPSFEATAEAPTVLPFPAPPARRPVFVRSRLALAAAVALLIGGLSLLSGKFDTGNAERSTVRVIDHSAKRTGPGTRSTPYDIKVYIDVKPNGDTEFKAIGGFIEEPPTGPNR
jgi:hypothetical protein